jgi:hypothetical protein
VRHARDHDLDRIEELLARIRALPGLKEKKRGVFYMKSKGFLHFHEDPRGMFADLSHVSGGGFDRLEVTDSKGQAALVEAARHRIAQWLEG